MKRTIAVLLIFILLFSTVSCDAKHFSFNKESNSENNTNNGGTDSGAQNSNDNINDNLNMDVYITRGEWAVLLGTYFGMDSCLDIRPYYDDVTSDNAVFPYVQSCTEWEVFDKRDSFKPDEYATVEFIVDSAVKASEADYSSFSSTLEYAKSKSINVENADSYATPDYAKQVIAWAVDSYSSKPFVEYENVEFNDNVIVMSGATCDSEGLVTTYSEENVAVGDIIITEGDDENPFGVARKVSEIEYGENGNTIIKTIEPELGDVYKELEFASIATVEDESTVKTVEGVTLEGISPVSVSSDASDLSFSTLAYNSNSLSNSRIEQTAAKGTNLSFDLSLSSGGKVTFSPSYNGLKYETEIKEVDKTGFVAPSASELAKETQKIAATDKYSAGWEIEGSMALKDFYVETELKTKKLLGVPYGIESFNCEIHYEVESSIKFKGKINEKLTIAIVPIPLGPTGLTLDVEIYVTASANGEIEIGTSLANTSTVKFEAGKGYRKTQESQAQNSSKLSISLKVGFGGEAVLKALGIKIIDLELEVGMGVDTSAEATKAIRYEDVLYKLSDSLESMNGIKEEVLLCVDAKAYLPTVSISLGTDKNTLAHKIGVKLTWKVMDKSGATFKSQVYPLHYEFGKGFVDKCTIDSLKIFDENTDENTDDEGQTENDSNESVGGENDSDENVFGGLSEKGILGISQYAVALDIGDSASISITTLPKGYATSDIKWETEDTTIANIQSNVGNGSCDVVAISSGVTYVSISTLDGKYSLKCSIIVKNEENTGFTALK